MRTWRELGISVIPKAHIFEYHAIYFMQALNGLGYKTKDFIEFSHQYGTRKDIHTEGLRDYRQKHDYQHNADHRASYPKVQKVKEKMRTKRKLRAKKYATKERIEDKKRRRSAALKNNNIILSFQFSIFWICGALKKKKNNLISIFNFLDMW